MKTLHFLFLAAVLLLAPQSHATPHGPSPQPKDSSPVVAYGPGERLVYNVSYFGVPAGHAVMEVLGKTDLKGREVFHVLSTVNSNKFVSAFYPVKDRIETFIDAEEGYSHAIRIKQRQGRKRREKAIDFDQIRHRATQYKNNQVETFLVPPMVQDSLSALYHFRNHTALEVGKSVFIDVHESNKNWELEIQVLGKEEIRTPSGTFKTIKAKALVRYEGLFMDKGDVTFWMTDDVRHIPVLIKTKIKIGSITAVLASSRPAEQTGETSIQAKAQILPLSSN
ncbi:MAG: DUF3108 domain-containing protein [Nitrospiria bacterium]